MTTNPSPKVIGILPGDVLLRESWPSERDFFRRVPHITGMATEDGMVILNPYSGLSDVQREAVALNEAARIFMARNPAFCPRFALTPEQELAFKEYGSEEEKRSTIAARLLSGDPSALSSTSEQQAFVRNLAGAMGINQGRPAAR